jgi:hypothetical protein
MPPSKPDETDLERIRLYRRVFGTPDGKLVFEDLMDILGLNASIETEAQGALHNAALAIMDRAGIFRDWNNTAYISSLFSLPYTPPKGDKE